MKLCKVLCLLVLCAGLGGCKPGAITGDPVAPYLGTITVGSQVACGAYLQFGVRPDQRTALANQIYSAASAIDSLTNGKVPTVAELHAALQSFNWNGNDEIYGQFVNSVTAIYGNYFDKINGNPKYAVEVLNALANGARNGASAYSTVTKS